MKSIINEKIKLIEENIINESKDDNIEDIQIKYKIKSNNFNCYTPPDTSYDFSFDITFKNKKSLTFNFVYNNDGVTCNDGAEGYYASNEINIIVNTEVLNILYDTKSEYGKLPLSNFIEDYYYDDDEIKNKFEFQFITHYSKIDYNTIIKYCIKLNKIIEKYINSLFLYNIIIYSESNNFIINDKSQSNNNSDYNSESDSDYDSESDSDYDSESECE